MQQPRVPLHIQMLDRLISRIRAYHFLVHLCKDLLPSISISAMQELAKIGAAGHWPRLKGHPDMQKLHLACTDPFLFYTLINIEVHHLASYLEYMGDLTWASYWDMVLDYGKGSLAWAVAQTLPTDPVLVAGIRLTLTDTDTQTVLEDSLNIQYPQGCTLGQTWKAVKQMFETWQTNISYPIDSLHSFPIFLSMILGIRNSVVRHSLATPPNHLLTGSQLIAYWYRAVRMLDTFEGSEQRRNLLSSFWPNPVVGGPMVNGFIPESDLLTLIGLTLTDYVCGQAPDLASAYVALQEWVLHSQSSELPAVCLRYLQAVSSKEVEEVYLDPVPHLFLIRCQHELLEQLHWALPSIIPPVNWSDYFTATQIAQRPTREGFQQRPWYHETLQVKWKQWLRQPDHATLLSHLGFHHRPPERPYSS